MCASTCLLFDQKQSRHTYVLLYMRKHMPCVARSKSGRRANTLCVCHCMCASLCPLVERRQSEPTYVPLRVRDSLQRKSTSLLFEQKISKHTVRAAACAQAQASLSRSKVDKLVCHCQAVCA
jgi:hypothetical protein